MQTQTFRIPGSRKSAELIWASRRERGVLRLVCGGLACQDIATKLRLSVHTVRHYVGRMCSDIGATNRGQLIIWAMKYPGILRGESVVLREHEDNCGCLYCCAMEPAA